MPFRGLRRGLLVGATLLAAAAATTTAVAAGGPRGGASGDGVETETPIRHLVVIFDENVSFDHYFGTYPHAANPPGEPAFHAAAGTRRSTGSAVLCCSTTQTPLTRSGWIAPRR